MLNHVIIERDACVIAFWLCLVAATEWVAPGHPHQLQEFLYSLLTEIMKKGLTTIFLPCAFRTGHFHYKIPFLICQLALGCRECYFTIYLHFPCLCCVMTLELRPNLVIVPLYRGAIHLQFPGDHRLAGYAGALP